MLFWRCSGIRAVEEVDRHARYPARSGPIMWLSVDDSVLLALQRCGLADPGHDFFNRLRLHGRNRSHSTERRQELDLREQFGRRIRVLSRKWLELGVA